MIRWASTVVILLAFCFPLVVIATNPDIPAVVDLLSSSPLPALCASAGFQFTGQTSLMAYGDIRSIDLQSMVSLASLGSVG